jgi:hypothetical protein
MVIARSVSETFLYVCKADRELPADKQTRFRLRRLPATIGLQLDNLHDATAAGHVSLRLGDQRIVCLVAGLAGWENLQNSKGEPVEFHAHAGERTHFGITIKNPAQLESVNALPEDVAEELAIAIRNGSDLTADDVKN